MAKPSAVESWFEALPQLLSDAGWEVEVTRPQASLSHCHCPWGGKLIRVTVSGIAVEDPPVNKSYVMVRPETCAIFEGGLLEHQAPGEAVVRRSEPWGMLRHCSILFSMYFNDGIGGIPVVTHQKMRRDYPAPGDSAYAFFNEGNDDTQAGFLLCSPNLVDADNKFDLIGIFSLPEEDFAQWSGIHFQLLLDSAQRAAHWFLNRPNLQELRQLDQASYIVLTIQSCKRGLPLYPVNGRDVEHTVTIAAGERLGLDRWIRFSPARVGSDKFRLSEFVKLFLMALGLDVPIYGFLDGRRLVPYQCALKREDWNRIRTQFVECFLLQKTAYRRANGGSTAPSLHEDVEPRFIQEKPPPMETFQKMEQIRQECQSHRVMVRRTFVEVESDEDSEWSVEKQRSERRHKTTTFLPVDIPVLAA